MTKSSRKPLPRPPRDLASRAYAVEGWSDPDLAFDNLGAQTKEQIVHLLPQDWDWDGKRVLDFGSGAGRTLRHFAGETEVAEFWGVDTHEPSVEWMRKNLAPINAWHTTENPPLGLEHGSFDLIYTVSVFSHLTDNSIPWLLELHRMLKPGGLLIISYMGRWISEYFAGEPWVEDRVGMNTLYHGRDWDLGGPAVLISDWWVREHWGRAFEVVDIDPQFMNFSWAVLKKKEGHYSNDDISRLSDDPREIVALRHHVVQLRREVELEIARRNEMLEAQASEYENRLAEYEGSTSWKATRPLRSLVDRRR